MERKFPSNGDILVDWNNRRWEVVGHGGSESSRSIVMRRVEDKTTEKTDKTYNITWSRPDGEMMDCDDLSPRTALARLINAIRESGPIAVHRITTHEQTKESAPPVKAWLKKGL